MLHQILKGFLKEEEQRDLLTLSEARDDWQMGRQGTGYEKLFLEEGNFAPLIARCVATFGEKNLLGWDSYLLRYLPGAFVPPHTDPPLLKGFGHLRLNAIVQQGERGGQFLLEGESVALSAGDAILFRPDLLRHAVSRLEAGRRLVLSVGCNFQE